MNNVAVTKYLRCKVFVYAYGESDNTRPFTTAARCELNVIVIVNLQINYYYYIYLHLSLQSNEYC